MKSNKLLICLAAVAMVGLPEVVRAQGDSSQGANPPDSAVGCIAPYTYIEGNPVLRIFHDLLEETGFATVFKARDFTGTVLVPTNAAFRNLIDAGGPDLESGETMSPALARSIVQYHILFDTIRATELAAMAGTQMAFDTTLSLAADGSNAGVGLPVAELVEAKPALAYENVTITVAATPDGAIAGNGTYTVAAAASAADVIWDDTEQPTQTCSAWVYHLDAVLLPAADLTALGLGAVDGAPSPSDGLAEGEGSSTAGR